MKYESAEGFRTALLSNFRDRSFSSVGSSTDMDSLLKIAASERFLARLTAQDERWILKGGLNLLARLGPNARLTRDADVATGVGRDELEELIRTAADRELDDFMRFRVRQVADPQGDGVDGGVRFPVDCLLAGKPLATFNLDIALLEPPVTDIEPVQLPDLLEFAGLPPPTVPAIRPSRQIIEKLHAYTRDYGPQENSRPRDFLDMLALTAALPFDASELREIGARVFAERKRQLWPPTLNEPPSAWTAYWNREGRGQHGLPDIDLPAAFDRLSRFWRPVLDGAAVTHWDSGNQTWR